MTQAQTYTGSYRRPPEAVDFAVIRELTTSDLFTRQALGAASKSPNIKSLRATHHRLAQCLAANMSDAEAALITGYSASRISILKGDPAFVELLAHYTSKRDEVFVNVTERMAGFATDVLEVLQERLSDKPDSFSNKELNELVKTTADRGGYSPVQKTESKTITLSASDLLALKQEVANRQNGQVRKINQIEEAQRVKQFLETDKKQSGNQGAQVGANDNGTPSDILEAPALTGLESQGDDIREACWEEVKKLDS